MLATSVVAPLRAKYPGARLEWVTDPAVAPLLEGVVDRVIPLDRHDGAQRDEVLRDVRGRFELVIDLENKPWSLRLAHAAAPERRRFQQRTALQALRSLVGRDTIFDEAHALELYAQAAGLERAGVPTLRPGADALERARRLMREGRWVAVSPGASKASKRWPAARFGLVARALREEGAHIALVGGPMDAPLLDAVRAECAPDVDLAAEPLPVVAAALGRVRLLIGNDSGLVHVTGAMGRPALAVFGPTSVRRWGPQAPGAVVSLGLACAPCSNHGGAQCPLTHHECLSQLSVERVLGEARRMLRAGSEGE